MYYGKAKPFPTAGEAASNTELQLPIVRIVIVTNLPSRRRGPWKPWGLHGTNKSHTWGSAPHPVRLKTGFFLLGCLSAVLNSTKSWILCKTWVQRRSTTQNSWAVERLSLELRKPVFPAYLTSPSCNEEAKSFKWASSGCLPPPRCWANTAATWKSGILPLRGAEIQLSTDGTDLFQHSAFTQSLLLLFPEVRFHLWCANREASRQDAALSILD